MNHIPDTGKMVSDTPRTDAAIGNSQDRSWMDGTLCAQLERELNAANSKIELLMSDNADVARIADERYAAEKRVRLLIAERDTARRQADQNYKLREEFRELLGTDDVEKGVAVVRDMKERIKRLEEAHSWHPIETAPHDYNWVLGYDANDGETGMIIFDRAYNSLDDDGRECHWTDGMREWTPTHWMPLPEPPEAKEVKP